MFFLVSLALPDDVSCIDGVPAFAVIAGMSAVTACVVLWNGRRATGNPVKHLLTEAVPPPRA
jgi:hypothetical protein